VESLDISVLGAAWHALEIVFNPTRFGFLALGVVLGLFLGVIPGLGGLLGLSLLLPFTFNMDAYAAVAIMLGLLAATSCSDSIPSVLLGVPGSVGAAATILDGHPMAKRGMAGRALGASFFASMMGGVIGAICLAVMIPIMRPIVLTVGTPELLAICVLGLSLVAILSSGMLLKGLAAAAMGILLSTTGVDANTGISRWTFDTIYLWDGIEVILVALGLFALPELADLFASGARQISQTAAPTTKYSQLEGARDVWKHKYVLLRSSIIGVVLSSVPGIGAAVIDWIAYGYAKRTSKNAEEFGNGDVRGIIAAESSNSANDGGHLVPTIAFGVPGGPPMALILGAFLVHNITPGPEMLTKRLDLTYTLVWTVALANVLGTALCFLFANQFAKIAQVRVSIIVPLILSIIFIGAFQASQDWGDFYTLFGFGLLGWIMKRANWPRPPLILGFVLGSLIENYMFISFERYGNGWVFRPVVVVILCASLIGILFSLWTAFKAQRKNAGAKLAFARPSPRALVTLGGGVIFATALVVSSDWPTRSQLVPQIICWAGLIACILQLASELVAKPQLAGAVAMGGGEHGDDEIKVSRKEYLTRSAIYAGWCLGFLAVAGLVGLLPAVFVFLLLFIRVQGGEKWRLGLTIAFCCTLFMWLLFQEVIHVPWPASLLGTEFPWLRTEFSVF
jgi:TctA family transporter